MNKKAWFTAAMALVLVACGGATGSSDSQITSQPSGEIGDTIVFRYKRLDNNYENWNM